MTRVVQQETALAKFCVEYYGTVKAASEILEIPYQMLRTNCKNPKRGWMYVEKMVRRFMGENKMLKEKCQYLNEQYSHLAAEYNKLVRKTEELMGSGVVL